ALAVQGQLHHAAAGHPGHLDGFELRLHLGHLGLHRLSLFHQLAEILHDPSSSVFVSSSAASSPPFSTAGPAAGSAAPKRSRTSRGSSPRGKCPAPPGPTGARRPRPASRCCAAPPPPPGSAAPRPATPRRPSACRSNR